MGIECLTKVAIGKLFLHICLPYYLCYCISRITKELISIAAFMDKEPWTTSVIPACPESFMQLTAAIPR